MEAAPADTGEASTSVAGSSRGGGPATEGRGAKRGGAGSRGGRGSRGGAGARGGRGGTAAGAKGKKRQRANSFIDDEDEDEEEGEDEVGETAPAQRGKRSNKPFLDMTSEEDQAMLAGWREGKGILTNVPAPAQAATIGAQFVGLSFQKLEHDKQVHQTNRQTLRLTAIDTKARLLSLLSSLEQAGKKGSVLYLQTEDTLQELEEVQKDIVQGPDNVVNDQE